MAPSTGQPRPRSIQALRAWIEMEMRELGRLGRVGLVGIIAAGLLAVMLGFRIQSVAATDMLQARANVLSRVVVGLPFNISSLTPGNPEFERFDSQVSRQLLGGETVRVKVWAPDGTIVYSDAGGLIGEKFPMANDRLEALEG